MATPGKKTMLLCDKESGGRAESMYTQNKKEGQRRAQRAVNWDSIYAAWKYALRLKQTHSASGNRIFPKQSANLSLSFLKFSLSIKYQFRMPSAKEWGWRSGGRGKTSAFEMVFPFLQFAKELFRHAEIWFLASSNFLYNVYWTNAISFLFTATKETVTFLLRFLYLVLLLSVLFCLFDFLWISNRIFIRDFIKSKR